MNKVSIIVPVYNVEHYLEQCIKSLLNQTYQNIEIVLVNDGSTDSSYSICQKFKESASNIYLLSQKNAGLSAARNTGLQYASGEYITFVDSDDWIDRKMIESLTELMNEKQADIVVGKHSLYYGKEKNRKENKKYFQETQEYLSVEALNEFFSGNLPAYAWGKLYRRKLFVENGICFPVGIHYEDIGTIYKLFYHAKKTVIVNQFYYFYRVRPGSITATYCLQDVKNIMQIQKNMNQYFRHSAIITSVQYQFYQLSLVFLGYSILCKANVKKRSKQDKQSLCCEIRKRSYQWQASMPWMIKNKKYMMLLKILLLRTGFAAPIIKSAYEIQKMADAWRNRK